jgi:hypothetical protein
MPPVGSLTPGLEDFIIDHNTVIPVGHSAYYVEAATAHAIVRSD